MTLEDRIRPENDEPGNQAYQEMQAAMARVTAMES